MFRGGSQWEYSKPGASVKIGGVDLDYLFHHLLRLDAPKMSRFRCEKILETPKGKNWLNDCLNDILEI